MLIRSNQKNLCLMHIMNAHDNIFYCVGTPNTVSTWPGGQTSSTGEVDHIQPTFAGGGRLESAGAHRRCDTSRGA